MESLVKNLDRLDPDERKKLKDLLSEKSKGLDSFFIEFMFENCPDDNLLKCFEASVVLSFKYLNVFCK